MIKKSVRGRWTHTKIADRIGRGFGQGALAAYIPWIGIRDLSSKGTSTRMWSPKTGRKMQFLSNIERDMFLIAEFREDFVDYWEQWPLQRTLTELAAQKLGYRHPIYIGTTIPVVMTVDGVLTLRRGDQTVRKAIDCKHSSDATNVRVREKVAIARLACKRTGLPHLLVTEKHVERQVVQNILWVRNAVRKSGEIEPIEGAFDMWPMRLHRHLAHSQKLELAELALNTFCKQFEADNGLPLGLGLRCMKLLMWQHLVEFDMNVKAPEKLRLQDLKVRKTLRLDRRLNPETV